MSHAASPALAPDDLVELGRVASAYGVKGWIKIQPHSADADVLLSVVSASVPAPARTWWLTRAAAPGAIAKPHPPQSYAVKAARRHGAHIVAQLAGIDDRDQADALRGMGVSMSRSVFPAPEEDEYYWVDLIGCAVYGQDVAEPALLGVVDEVLDNGAHAVLKVLRQRQAAPDAPAEPVLDAKGRPVEVLVPFVQAHIRAVDLAGRRIDSDWPLDF
ncbi:ribosome maturation factor RimM [Bordetella genomosp. 9]|uniref:Ribosome maturation factor RimM n=1 Tax=Bordetella genomosp. 9 TaxID=1416803 RepID=A0A1W6Z5U5_9BORD|nr:ribosome maturation factor RimM [Bordetella genomosp. 9]ARP88727.1 ribosome maturation factor RimM [Bordetella genomosp. 9]ARP91191.1 ribosome maturation factor RimM [Bordetella genomosp. 9]